MTTLAKELRYCSDIGMFALDRSILASCVHKTKYCDDNCFNNKLFRIYPAMLSKDTRNEMAWDANDTEGLRTTLARRKHQTKRTRLMTRGEAVSDYQDVAKVENIVRDNPDSDWWIPTRAWRNPVLYAMLVSRLDKYSNVKLLCSTDPSNTIEELEHIETMGYSSMFFGDDTFLTMPSGRKMFKCPKTWQHKKGHCATCVNGCFRDKTSKHGPVHVHLKQH